jgi:hypothetical protein
MKRALLVPLVLALALAAGCGGGSSRNAASSTSAPAATASSNASSVSTGNGAKSAVPKDNCGMISEAKLSEAAGFTLKVTKEDPLGVPGCQYTAASGGILYLTYYTDDFEYRLALSQIKNPKMLSGIGKEAFEGSPANFRSVEVLLEDGRSFQVQGGAAADDRDALKRIATIVVTTL